jgi:NAD+ diphosphatase
MPPGPFGATPSPEDPTFVFAEGRMLVHRRDRLEVPTFSTVLEFASPVAGPFLVGDLDGRPAFAAALETAPDGLEALGLRQVLAEAEAELGALAGRASQIVEWYFAHRYCGRCGTPTEHRADEPTARCCPTCGALHFPRINPAVITLVHRGDEVLLAHNRAMLPAFYALIAGFVEPGETLEQTVAREIREEVGVEIEHPTYMASQAWPFPSQLMMGFFAEYRDGEISLNDSEIDDARWFRYDALPDTGHRPAPYSIAGRLIEHFVRLRSGSVGSARL